MRFAAIIIAVGLLTTIVQAQESPGRSAGPAGRGLDDAQPLTAEQKAQVKAILAKYKADSLTAADAKAINEAFRAAGLRNGPSLQEAIKDAGFVPARIGELDPPPARAAVGRRTGGGRGRRSGERENGRADRGRQGRGGGYSVEQAISDRAQLHTIAFDGLAFLTGEMACNTFLPPGKVADFNGFQYMRDIDTNQLGHNTSFVPRAANNMLAVLTDQQKAQLIALAKEQEKMLSDFAYKRFPLIKAFHRQLTGDSASPGAAGPSNRSSSTTSPGGPRLDSCTPGR